MKKIISFGKHSAELYIGEHRATLVMSEKGLPVELADVLNDAGDMHVHSVQKNDGGFGCIGITHDLSASDILAEVCAAITRTYDTDTTISNARP